MIEVSTTEMILFAWAFIATGFAIKARIEADQTMTVVMRILSDEKVRDLAVESWSDFEKRMGANNADK